MRLTDVRDDGSYGDIYCELADLRFTAADVPRRKYFDVCFIFNFLNNNVDCLEPQVGILFSVGNIIQF